MALNVTNWVWEHSRAANGCRLVLLAIAHEAGRDGEAEMTVLELARKCHLSDRAAQLAIRALVTDGELEIAARAHQHVPARYRVIMSRGEESAPLERSRGEDTAPLDAQGRRICTPDQGRRICTPDPPEPEPDLHKQARGEESAPLETSDVFKGSRSTTGISEVQVKAPAVAERPDVERLCAHLADRIEANGSKRPVITKKWRDSARLMIDRDGRTEQHITAAIDWCQDHEFWRSNILSMPKLREKYDQLRLQASRPQGGSHQAETNQLFSRARERARARDAQEAHSDQRGNGVAHQVHPLPLPTSGHR